MATQNHRTDDTADRDTLIGWLTVVLSFSLALYRPWLTLAATLILLLWLFGGGLRSRLVRLKQHRLSLAILVFLALNLISLLWSTDPSAGFRYIAKYRYLLLVPILASAVPAKFRRPSAAALQVGAVASVALSLGVVAGFLHLGDAHPGNPSATMAHLDYTLILALTALLALTRVLYGAMNISARLLWAGAFAITTVGLVFNIGRSGQLGFLVGLAALLAHWSRGASTRRVGVAVVLTAVVAAVIFGFSLPVLQRMNDAREEIRGAIVDHDYDSNLGGRIAAMRVAGRILRDDPLLGTGVGANIPRLKHVLDTELQDLKPSIYWYRHFHNQYTQIATELGLTGLLSLAWIFWELIRGPFPSRELGAAATVITAVYLVGFLGEPFFHKQIPLIAFAVLAGLISSARLDDVDAAGT